MPPAVIGGALALGGSVIGGVASNNAAGKAADASRDGIAATQAAARQARSDAINLFQRGLNSAQTGIGSALNFYQKNADAKLQPFVQGNMAAQQILGQGATQANNAILGLPVDMSFANNPRSLSADYSGIQSARLPTLGAAAPEESAPNGLQALLTQAEDQSLGAFAGKNNIDAVKSVARRMALRNIKGMGVGV
jgi:hypothetical protein